MLLCFLQVFVVLFCFVLTRRRRKGLCLGPRILKRKARAWRGMHGALLPPDLGGWIYGELGSTTEGGRGLCRLGVHTECAMAQVLK